LPEQLKVVPGVPRMFAASPGTAGRHGDDGGAGVRLCGGDDDRDLRIQRIVERHG
jgi:hypothetical protein